MNGAKNENDSHNFPEHKSQCICRLDANGYLVVVQKH